MEKAANKTERLWQVEQLLLTHPHGLRKASIAKRLGVHRSTASRYIDELSTRLPMYEEDDGTICIERNHYLNNIKVTIHEALIFHLATCLFTNSTDRVNPHASSAIRKLGTSLKRFSPVMGANLLKSAEYMDEAGLKPDTLFVENLEVLTLGWANSQFVDIYHFSKREERVKRYTFGVYFITVYASGQTLQVIGKCIDENHLRTLRLDRIKKASLLEASYSIPESFNPFETLRSAWGIWYSEEEPVEVVLHFSARVASRVRETQWHRREETKNQEDGTLIWKALIDEPLEMLPWIRGWGADVEVLKPGWLREQIAEELKEAAKIYKEGG